MTDTPAAARTLLAHLAGWSSELRHSSGTCEFGGLSEDTDGNGKRRRLTLVESVDSVHLRARHIDGRALVALWMRRPGTTPAGKPKGWALDMAWRGRHTDELAPRRISARQLTAYACAPDAASALAACQALEPKSAKTELGETG